jgi:hypothetical protein
MAIQFSETVRNARLDAIEVDAGTAPIMKIFSGAPPANTAAANSGTELASGTLPSDWMAAAATGAKAKAGTWNLTGVASGVAGHFRLFRSNGTTVVMQGTCGQGSGDMSLVNTNIANAQPVPVDSFTLTDGNA